MQNALRRRREIFPGEAGKINSAASIKRSACALHTKQPAYIRRVQLLELSFEGIGRLVAIGQFAGRVNFSAEQTSIKALEFGCRLGEAQRDDCVEQRNWS